MQTASRFFTEVQADFRRQLESRTLLPPSSLPNKRHMSVHDAFHPTAMWLTFNTEKMPRHWGPNFPFSSLLQSYLIWLREKNENDDKQTWNSLMYFIVKTDLWIFHALVMIHRRRTPGRPWKTLLLSAWTVFRATSAFVSCAEQCGTKSAFLPSPVEYQFNSWF